MLSAGAGAGKGAAGGMGDDEATLSKGAKLVKPLEELYQSKSSEAQAVQERCAAGAAVLQAILQVDPHPAAAESFVQRGGLTALSWILRRFFSTGGS